MSAQGVSIGHCIELPQSRDPTLDDPKLAGAADPCDLRCRTLAGAGWLFSRTFDPA